MSNNNSNSQNLRSIPQGSIDLLRSLSRKTGKPISWYLSKYFEVEKQDPQETDQPFDSRELREYDSIQQHNAELSY